MNRRKFIHHATAVSGLAGLSCMTIPLLGAMSPADTFSGRQEIDIAGLEPGQSLRIEDPVTRMPIQITNVEQNKRHSVWTSDQRRHWSRYLQKNQTSSPMRPEISVLYPVCTRRQIFLISNISRYLDEGAYFRCTQCNAHYDVYGRVISGSAPYALNAPVWRFADDHTIVINEPADLIDRQKIDRLIWSG